MKTWRYSAQAFRDLLEALAYLDDQTEESQAGDRLVHAIAAACDRIAAFPQIGRKRDELRQGLRSFPVGRYVVLYRTKSRGAETIEIARILHQRQNLLKAFPPRKLKNND